MLLAIRWIVFVALTLVLTLMVSGNPWLAISLTIYLFLWPNFLAIFLVGRRFRPYLPLATWLAISMPGLASVAAEQAACGAQPFVNYGAPFFFWYLWAGQPMLPSAAWLLLVVLLAVSLGLLDRTRRLDRRTSIAIAIVAPILVACSAAAAYVSAHGPCDYV